MTGAPHLPQCLPSPFVSVPVMPDTIGRLIDGAERVLRGEVSGSPEEFHGMKITAYDLGFSELLCDA